MTEIATTRPPLPPFIRETAALAGLLSALSGRAALPSALPLLTDL